jgi:signal transduction histidine kinase
MVQVAIIENILPMAFADSGSSGAALAQSPPEPRKYAVRIGSGLVLAAIALLVMGVSSYTSIQRLTDRQQWVEHTHAVIDELWGLVSAAKSIILAERLNLLTGDDEYDALMRSQIGELDTRLGKLKQLINDNSLESARLKQLNNEIKGLEAFATKVVATRRTLGLPAATSLIQTGYGIRLMQQIEQRAALLDATEQDLFVQRSREAQEAGATTLHIIGFGTLIVIICTAFAGCYARLSLRALHASSDDLVRSHAQLNQLNEELGRSNAELEQFAYSASHDLQEPLRMIASYVQLLSDRYRGRLDADADDFIDFAVDGATRMKLLINDLLVYSRAGRGHEPQSVEAQQAVEWALSNLSLRIDETHARVIHGTLPTVKADPTQLGEVFQNLIDNAIKFRGIEPPQIEINASRNNGNWLFSVKDNGIGIDPQYQSRIFQMFQRLHGRNEYAGTGIGLAVCRKIVERHGGRIWVESAKDTGADFRFTLPVLNSTKASEETEEHIRNGTALA